MGGCLSRLTGRYDGRGMMEQGGREGGREGGERDSCHPAMSLFFPISLRGNARGWGEEQVAGVQLSAQDLGGTPE